MIVIFFSDPLNPRQPDDAYGEEADAAAEAGAGYGLVSYETLVYEGDAHRAVRHVEEQSQEQLGVLRGWMLTPDQYGRLYDALVDRGVRLINDPAAYRHCHYLPESYGVIRDKTPRSVWLETDGMPDMDRIMALLQPFGDRPLVLKDYVKSRKHEWAEACFISSAADRAAVERTIRRFLELQGDDLAGGLVFREYVDLEPIGTHSRSGMPLTREYRTFWLDSRPLLLSEYWEEGNYTGDRPPIGEFEPIARTVRSRFFTMDLAKQTVGGWLIVELGDGQVAALPDRADVPSFYALMADAHSRQTL
jgi:hypothetical protein